MSTRSGRLTREVFMAWALWLGAGVAAVSVGRTVYWLGHEDGRQECVTAVRQVIDRETERLKARSDSLEAVSR